jgi:hypothetical protein
MGFGKKRSSKVGVGAITTNKKKLFAEGGMMDDGKSVDPVSGNDVPTGSLAEEVRDDVDAKLSPGEFVIPADVVRFIGLERLMKLRDEAKQGLARMNDIGQMGNAEAVGEASDDSFEEDDDFENEIDGIMKEVDQNEIGRQTEMAFNTGGFVNASYYDIEKAPKNPALDIRFFKDNEGKDFYMPFINGKPMKPMPNGATQTGAPTKRITPSDTRGEAGGGAGGAGGGGGGGGGVTNNTSATSGTTSIGVDGNEFITGTYTGSNLADFGNPTMIYNPGGSGPGGELMPDDLWQNSVSKWQVSLGSAALSALASAMGVPGILTMGARAAMNKFGVDAFNTFFAEANQRDAARVSGIDLTQPGGVAAAASQIDTLTSMPLNQAANTPGVTGTGGYAASISSSIADQLNASDIGLLPEQIAAATQAAANAYRDTKDADAAVNAAQQSLIDSGVSADYAKTIDIRAPVETRDLSGADFMSDFREFDKVADMEYSMPYEASLAEDVVGDFWSWDDDDMLMGSSSKKKKSDDEDEDWWRGGSMSSPIPKIDASLFKKQESEER